MPADKLQKFLTSVNIIFNQMLLEYVSWIVVADSLQ